MRRALLLATLLACGRGSPRAAPSPLRIVPTGAYRGQVAHVRVTGDGFNARAVHQLGGPSQLDDRFRVRIGGVELENVTWIGTADGHQAIEADVPADLPVGLWDVEVTDPLGEAGTLRGGWTESDHVPPRLAVSATTPSSVEAGVAFDAEVRVQNQGGETALLSSVTLDGEPLQFGDAALLPGEVRALPVRWSAPAGSVSWVVAASGVDGVTGEPLPAASGAASFASLVPPRLAIAAGPLPAFVNAGQRVSIALTVHNEGEVAALSLLPALLVPAGVTVDGLQPQDVPAAAQVQYAATLTASSPGALGLQASASGVDGITGASISVPAQILGTLEVQRPAALSVSSLSAPAQVSRGQTFTVQVQIANTGDAAALGVVPQLTASGVTVVAAPAPQDIAGGAAATFTYQLTEAGTSPGTLQLSFSASGADVNSGSAVTAVTTQATVVVQAPAALAIDPIPLPGRISRGMAVPLSVTIHNSGGASAHGVTLSTMPLATGGASWTAGAVPAAFDLAGGASATVSLPGAESGLSDGSLAFSVSASGSDGNSGASIGATASSAAAVVEQPAALQAVLSMPAAVNEGQAFVVTLQVSNTGEATAAHVTPQAPVVSSASGVVLSITGSPAPLDIAGGSSVTFAWTASSAGTATGVANVSIGADGADANSGAALSTSGSGAVEVDPPSALTVTSFSVPETVSRGQTFTATLVVHNGGGSTALNVTPALTAAAVSGGAAATLSGVNTPVSLSPGTSATFSWQVTENGSSAGALRLDGSASGTDSNNGATVSTAASSAVQVEEPAHLSVVSFAAPSSIDRGQSFTVRLVVTNTGGALVKQVSAAPTVTVTGGAHAITSSTATPVDLGAGASAAFSWSYQEDGTAAGTLAITATATGTEGNTGAAVAVDSAPAGIAVQVPAALAASWTVPASAGVGTSFPATLTVTNGGGADAANVVPAATLSGPASLSGGPVPASATIAGGASATFTFTVSATAVGNAQLAATVTGSDANTGDALSASATSALVALGEATTIATDPFCAAAGGACTDTTTFAYLFSYQGQIYLGPNRTGTGSVRMAPDGSGPTQVNWQLEVNTDPLSAARNSAYQGSGAPLCHTIGAPGCKQNSTACGPDNESGHGIFLSGVAGTTEWYALTGASTIGGARYLYMTNPGLPLATGGYDDLAFVQVQAGQQGATRMATAGHFFNGKLYFGLLDSGTGGPSPTAPVLNVLTRMPSLPGYTAALGTDLVNLQGAALPAIGAAGTPANSGTSWLMIDAITDFAGVLYLGNNGGLVRSANGNPAPCAGSCSDWVNVTPSAAAWGNKTSVTVSDSVLGTLEPAQRAIPGIASFGGRLFAARNTTAGPQLWSCAPAGGANAQQCDPSDWSLVAGASDLTQLGDAGNSAVTLLAATAAHLYVGFNNAAGLQIWRTANANAAVLSDFTGRADCVAGTSGCGPVGGAGLGNASTRIFDGKVLTLGDQDWLYVSAGDGATAPKVSRIVP